MEYRILGPLALVEDERDLAPAGAKQQALLGIFLLHPGETLSRDRLIDELWGSRPPETAGNTLQVYVSQLRKLLPPGALVTRLPGYALEVDPESLDASRFERLARGGRDALARGDSAEASTALERALALWRGPVLAGVAFEGTAAGEAARLEELRVSAAEDRIDAGLALGRHAELVGELEALVSEHPLRERLRGQLMVALYRSGRQADALEVYQRTRAELVDQLGIEPGPQLHELQRAVLAQDPALAPPAAVEALPTHETRKVVTVLGARLTHGENRDPEVAEARQERLLETAAEVVARYGGALERAPTEGVLALFGATVTHEDDALRAVRAACDLHEESGDAEVALGIVTGEAVIVGGRLAAAGNVVTSALRLARAADPGATLLSARTLPLVRGAVDVGPSAERHSGALEGWRLVALRPDAEPIARRLDTPLVGREDELAALRAAFEEARADRRCRVFTVLGEGGIGKSRLVAELVAGLGDDVVALTGRCRSFGEGIAFRPVAEILRAAAGDVTEEQIGALLEGEPDAGAVAGYLAAASGSSDTLASAVEVDWAVRRLFEALARRTPLVVVVDDIHWAEPALLDLLELLPDTVRDAPVFLLCLARPELLEERPRWEVSLALEPLTAGESDLLIDRLLAGTELPEPLRARLAEAAEGNALYIEQALAYLGEHDADDAELEMPPTIKALLDARLDRLPARESDVLERAAVMGRELWPGALTALADHEEELEQVLASLTRKELIEPTRTTFLDEDAYRFRHKLIREAAYRRLTKRLRAGLHERFADWLEGRPGGRDAAYDDVLGYHLEQAAQYRAELGEPSPDLAARAAGHLGSAGRRALARSDTPAAVGLLSRAAALAAGEDAVRSAQLVDLAEARRDAGDLNGADRALEEALALAERAGSAVAAEAARIGQLRIAFQTDSGLRVEETLPVAERAIAVFEAAGGDRELARALYVRAWISWLGCRAAEAEQALEAAIVHARRAGDDRAEASALHLLVGVALYGPMPVAEGRRRCEEILETHASKLRVTASALRALAGLAAQQGRFDEADVFMARDRSITQELGTRLTAAAAAELYGWVLMLAEDLPAAEAEVRRGFDSLLEMGDRSSASTLAALLAQILYALGRFDEVLELAALGRDESSPDDLHTQIQWRGPMAKVLARRGETEEAERLAREGVELAGATDFLNVRATALLDLAEVMLADGRADEAAAVVGAAAALFEQKGNVVGLARSRALV